MEESVALGIPCVNIRPCIHQDRHHRITTLQNRQVEDRVSLVILCVNIRPRIGENTHNRIKACQDCHVERPLAAGTL